MNRFTILSAAILLLFTASLCSADSLVITYRSGKTQTVVLDEPSATVNSWQFVGGVAAVSPSQQPTAPPEMPQAESGQPAKDENKLSEKAPEKVPEKKSNLRFKFNAPPIKD